MLSHRNTHTTHTHTHGPVPRSPQDDPYGPLPDLVLTPKRPSSTHLGSCGPTWHVTFNTIARHNKTPKKQGEEPADTNGHRQVSLPPDSTSPLKGRG